MGRVHHRADVIDIAAHVRIVLTYGGGVHLAAQNDAEYIDGDKYAERL